jgi:UPF0271 protein
LSPDELELLLLQQVGTIERIAKAQGAPLHHIKLHGALYHEIEASEPLARHYLRAAVRWWPRCRLYVLAGGLAQRLAERAGRSSRISPEAFADRAYRDDGTLVPRGCPGAVLEDSRQVEERMRVLRKRGVIQTESGNWIHLRPRTVCLHADTSTAPKLARMLARVVGNRE